MDGRQISKEVWPHPHQNNGPRIRYRACPECGKHEHWPFSVDARGYKCFRCGAHGGVLKLLEVCTGMSSRDARDWVIDKAGLRGIELGDAAKVVVRQQATELRRAVEERDRALRTVSSRRKCLAFDIRQLRGRIETAKREAGRWEGAPTRIVSRSFVRVGTVLSSGAKYAHTSTARSVSLCETSNRTVPSHNPTLLGEKSPRRGPAWPVHIAPNPSYRSGRSTAGPRGERSSRANQPWRG
jgi:hypothetical protein